MKYLNKYFSICVLLILIQLSYVASDYEISIKCLANCDALVNPARPVILNVECRNRCLGIKYHWELRPDEANVKKQLYANDTMSQDTLSLIIKRNVLLPKEQYCITVTATKPRNNIIRKSSIILNMARCSKKYPCIEETSAIPSDYIDRVQYSTSSPKPLPEIENDVNSLQNMKSDQVLVKKKDLLIDLRNLPLNNSQDVQKAAKMVQDIVSADNSHLTPNIVRLTSEANENIVDAEINIIKKSKEPEALAGEVKTLAKTVLSSVQYIVRENKSQLSSHRDIENVTNISVVEPFPFTENYPIYDHFDIVYQRKKENVEVASINTVNIVNKLGYGNVLTMAASKQKDDIITNNVCILNIIENPEKLKDKSFDLCDARMHFSENLPRALNSKTNNKLLITFSVLKNNPYWWSKINISSDIVSFEFRNDAHQKISTAISNYIDLYINVKNLESNSVTGTNKIPLNNIDDIFDDTIAVHQIHAVEEINIIIIQFNNMKNDDEIQVVITNNRRPSSQDFQQAYIIPSKEVDKFTIITNILIRAGTKCYIGVHPTKNTIQNSGVLKNNYYYYNYSVQFSSVACNRWSENYNNWFDGDCKVGPKSTIKRIHCICFHLSSFAVSVNNLESQQDSILYIPFELQRQYNYIIAIFVTVLYVLYFIALGFAIYKDHRRFKSKKVLFLMDNNLTNEYEYVIAVYTSSGTTANIGIRIYGTEGDTDAHALFGFTKPILQTRCDDWFLLLTNSSLGDLKTLELWTDCYGSRCSWYCRKVIVYNMQNNCKWIFNVDCGFSVLNNNTFCSIVAKETISEDISSKWSITKKALQEEHLWLSFFKRPKQPAFTFIAKVTVTMNIFLNMMLFIMLFYGVPSVELHYYFDVREYQIEFQDFGIVLASAILSVALNYIFIHIFTNAHPFRPTTLTEPFTYYLSKKWRYAAWLSLIVIIITTSLVLIIFGLWMGYTTSLLWVTSVIFAILLYIILLESIRVIVSTILKPQVSLDYIDKDLDMSEINTEKKFLLNRYGENSMRPLFSKLYQRLSEQDIKIILEKELSRIELRNIVIDIILFSIYFITLCCVVLIHKDNMAYYSTRNIENMFVEDKYIGKMAFHDINSQGRLYRYLRITFLPAVHVEEWYENYRSNENGLTIDFNTKLLGIPRVRQIRIQNNSCTISGAVQFILRQCNAEYSGSIQETRDFAPQWKSKDSHSTISQSDTVWLYKSGWDSHSSYIFGELAIYPSGGYLVYLGRTRQNSELVLQYLENTKWIDEFTRAIFIEVCFYNANRNLFNILTLIIEKSATGKYITKYSIRTAKFLFLHNEIEISSYITFILFVLMMLILSWKKLKLLQQNSISELISDAWNIVDLIIIIFGFGFIIVSYCRTHAVSNLLKTLENAAHNEFVSFTSALYWDEFLTIVATVLVAISTIRIWKLLTFARMFRIFELTLYLAFKYLVAMLLVELLVVFAFTVTGFITFGPYSSDFRTIFQTIISLILLGFGYNGNFNYEVLDESYASIGYLYYVCYMILLLIIVNLFITIIVVAYESAKDYFDESDSEKFLRYNLLNFLKEEYKYITSKTKGRQIWWNITNTEEINLKAGKNEIAHKLDVARETMTVKSRRMIVMQEIAHASLDILTNESRNVTSSTNEIIKFVLESVMLKESGDDDNEIKDDVYIIVPYNDGYKYCAKTRLDDMLLIVNYLLRSQTNKENILQKQKIDISALTTMNYMITNLCNRLEQATAIKYSDKNTFVTFEDLGLELIESDSSSNTSSDNNYD